VVYYIRAIAYQYSVIYRGITEVNCIELNKGCPVGARCLPVARCQRARSERCLPVDRVSPVGRALPVGPRFHGKLTLQRATLRVHFAVSLVSATYLPGFLRTYLSTNLPGYLRTYLRTYVPTYLTTYLPTHLPTYLPTCLVA